MMPPPPSSFADPVAAVRNALAAYVPPDPIGTAAWAARDRYLNNQGGGWVGRWQHTEAPFLVGPMDDLDSPDYLEVALVGPGRCGKTAVAENWLGKSIVADPAPFLWYEPTELTLKSYVKAVITPMIDLHDCLSSRQGLRPIDDSVGFKRFRGMSVEFLTMAYNNLINKSAARIVLDEIDAADKALGNVFGLADIRRQTFGRSSKILAISHPDRAGGLDDRRWTDGVMALYARSNRRLWYWPCMHCGAYSSPNPTAARVMTIDYPEGASLDEIEQAARLLCPTCGGLIEDHHRHAMNQAGKWIGIGEEIDEDGNVTGQLQRNRTSGYWIVGAMSNFVIGGIGGLARALEEARRAHERGADSGLQDLKDVTVKRLGIPFDPPRVIGDLDSASIADRARPDLKLKEIPEGVRFLTAFVDVQGNRFELMVRGWGIAGESWVVDVDRWNADPSAQAEDWDDLLARMSALAYPLAGDPSRVMRLRAWGYDTQGSPGVTAQAYDAWIRWNRKNRVRLLGRFSGRESFSIMPTNGRGTPNAPRLVVVRPDSGRKDRAAKARGIVPVAQFNANTFKDDLAGQLRRADPGPWHVHFPEELRPPEGKEDRFFGFFDQLTAEVRSPRGVWEKKAPRNEALDLIVGCHVLAHLNGLPRIRWDAPPAWAADWDRNSNVKPAEAGPTSPPAGPGKPPSGPAPSPATGKDYSGLLRRLA